MIPLKILEPQWERNLAYGAVPLPRSSSLCALHELRALRRICLLVGCRKEVRVGHLPPPQEADLEWSVP